MNKCLQCGKEYEPIRATSKFCSTNCRIKYNRLTVPKKSNLTVSKCLQCNKEIKQIIGKKARLFCNDACRIAYRRNQLKIGHSELKRDFIYIIQCKSDYYKIGFATDVRSRISAMQTGNPFRIRLIFSTMLPDPQSLERYLHNNYKNQRVRGEWFRLNHVEVKDIASFVVGWILENPRV